MWGEQAGGRERAGDGPRSAQEAAWKPAARQLDVLPLGVRKFFSLASSSHHMALAFVPSYWNPFQFFIKTPFGHIILARCSPIFCSEDPVHTSYHSL